MQVDTAAMEFPIILFLMVPTFVAGLYNVTGKNITTPSLNSSDEKKDMYVIHAMVYQVGIITNKTSNETDNNIGNQEAVTFFHSNGSKVDFSKIPQPILTNVTAQSLVGIAPNPSIEQPLRMENISKHWNLLQSPAGSQQQREQNEADHVENSKNHQVYKRSNEVKGNDVVKIEKGSVVVPKEAGVHSLALPPLLTLNNNFTNIPVPIPNTSVVHYAKINTLVHATGQ